MGLNQTRIQINGLLWEHCVHLARIAKQHGEELLDILPQYRTYTVDGQPKDIYDAVVSGRKLTKHAYEMMLHS